MKMTKTLKKWRKNNPWKLFLYADDANNIRKQKQTDEMLSVLEFELDELQKDLTRKHLNDDFELDEYECNRATKYIKSTFL